MPEQYQTVITRKEQFVVGSNTTDTYGNLLVTGTNGSDYKVGVKRSHLHPMFQPGAEVLVGYAEYRGKEYIATAEQTGKHEVVETPVETNTAASKEMTKEDWDIKDKVKRVSIERQKALELAVETAKLAGVKESTSIVAVAIYYEHYLATGESKPKKNRVVEEAKKLGAEVIKDE